MNYIGITMGDPAGIGCEIVLKALRNDDFRKKSIIFGSYNIIKYFKELLKIDKEVKVISDIDEFDENKINIVDVLSLSINDFEFGKVSPICGDAAYKYVEASINWAMNNKIKAVVTAPLNKESLHLGGHNFDGHTEIFATLTNTKKYAMVLWSEKLKVIHVSTHVSLREACNKVKKDRIVDTIDLANAFLKNIGLSSPRIAVAGLNPHAGESGLFGDEEILEIIPAIKQAKQMGINVYGPISPDTVFLKAFKGEFDIVVAMYHDQGHIPMKLLSFDTGVNITAGLPFIRTSVDHGTAFGKAGKGIANESSMIEAIKVASYTLNKI